MLPLENVRILDLTQLPPGQFCTMMLGDMGADVIRVEQLPKNGGTPENDDAVKWANLIGSTYQAFNRNKRSITMNLADQEAQQILRRILEDTDVVVEGFRPGVAERLGVDFATLRHISRRIILCSISGYGQTGPYRDLPGHDINYVGFGGALPMFGSPPPVIPNLLADYGGATLHSVIGILLALLARAETGEGQHVDIAYTDGVISLMTQFASGYLAGGDDRAALTAQQGMLFSNAGYGVYETRDGKYISLGCVEPWFWARLCHALGREDFVPAFAKWDQHAQIREHFAKLLLTKDRDEWFSLFQAMDIPVGKVYDIDEAFSDPQIVHRRMVVDVEGHGGKTQKHVGIPVKLTSTPGSIRSQAPVPGEHTAQVLSQLGYTKQKMEELQRRGVVFLASAPQSQADRGHQTRATG